MNKLKIIIRLIVAFILLVSSPGSLGAQTLSLKGKPVQLDIREAGVNSLRISLKPIGIDNRFLNTPTLSEKDAGSLLGSITQLEGEFKQTYNKFQITVYPDPIRVVISNRAGDIIQELTFQKDGTLLFKLDDNPILGMGEGGPRMGENWRSEKIEFDRKGRLHKMEPRWQANAYGSRNPVAMLAGTGGWGLYIVSPWGQFDLRDSEIGIFIPVQTLDLKLEQQTQKNQQQTSGKGLPPPDSELDGVFDIFKMVCLLPL